MAWYQRGAIELDLSTSAFRLRAGMTTTPYSTGSHSQVIPAEAGIQGLEGHPSHQLCRWGLANSQKSGIFSVDWTSRTGEVAKIRILLYILDYLGTLLAFVLVFLGLWRIMLTPDVVAVIALAAGLGLGIGSFIISKRLKRNPRVGQERL